MNFFSNLLTTKGSEHGSTAASFPPASHKSSSPAVLSPPVSPRATSSSSSAAIDSPQPVEVSHHKSIDAKPKALPESGPTDAHHADSAETAALHAQVTALKKERAALEARYAALAGDHIKEKEFYEVSVEELRQRLAKLNDSVSLLREDREILNREVLAEREKYQQITEELERIKIHNSELETHQQILQHQITKMGESQLNARKFAANCRSIEDAHNDASFRQRFNLPATEFPITSYYCCHKHLYHGWLYITPAYVCFEPAILSSENSRISTPLTSISVLSKVRGFKYIPGTDNALLFTLKSGTEYFFNNFTHRDAVIANLVQQADKFGHRFLTDSEKLVEDEGKPPKPSGQTSKDTDSLPSHHASASASASTSEQPRTTTRARSLSDVA